MSVVSAFYKRCISRAYFRHLMHGVLAAWSTRRMEYSPHGMLFLKLLVSIALQRFDFLHCLGVFHLRFALNFVNYTLVYSYCTRAMSFLNIPLLEKFETCHLVC